MPLYEYVCSSCQRHIEKIQKFSDPELTQCPHCGGALSRVITAPAFTLKGGGWYADGYSSAKPGATAGESAAPAASTESSTPATPAAPSTAAPAASSAPAKS